MAKPAQKNVRVVAVQLLLQLLQGGGSLTKLLPDAQQLLPEADRSLLQALCYGYSRWAHQLDGLLRPLLKKPLKKKDQDIVILMRLGILQLEHMRISEHAAVDNTVSAAVQLKKPWARGLINGVLRNFLRQREQLTSGLTEPEAHSHPAWMLAKLQDDWPDRWSDLVAAANRQAPMVLRNNASRVQRSEYLLALQQASLPATEHVYAAQAICLEQAVSVERLPGFSDGMVSVQDTSAQLAASLLANVAKGRLLDACAAPGGKTMHALEIGHWQEIVSLDKDEDRLSRVKDNLDRLQLGRQVKLIKADANNIDEWWDGTEFDGVLLDAPCSGTGVIRRHPDIKLLRRPTDIAELVAQQQSLLTALWTVLKPGGYLLYATCSIFKAENEELVASFVNSQGDARHQEINADWGVRCSFGRQILTGQHGMDGFYYSLLEKSS